MFILLTILLTIGATAAEQRTVVIVPIQHEYSWQDDAYLSAIPAATILGEGKPLVLAVDAENPWRPEVLDFMRRYQPTRIIWIGADKPVMPIVPTVELPEIEYVESKSALDAALSMLSLAWPEMPTEVVFYYPENRSAALVAAAFASRLSLPLIPLEHSQVGPELIAKLEKHQVQQAYFVGTQDIPVLKKMRITQLNEAKDVISILAGKGLAVEYLSVVNSNANTQRNRNLSLAAPLLAAGRSGVVLPFDIDTQWKREFIAAEDGSGEFDINERRAYKFLISKNTNDAHYNITIDVNHDGRFRGKREQPLTTGDNIRLGETVWTIDLDAVEGKRGKALWLTSPSAAQIHDEISTFYNAPQQQLEYLCLVGWPDALPMAVMANGQGIDADLVSDLPFTQRDEDPFFDIAFARFIAEDLPAATLLACRGFARSSFVDREWENKFATAEWEGATRMPLTAAGFDFVGHHAGEADMQSDSPLTEVALLVHGSHANWQVMGKTYSSSSNTLLAPALVESAGCSTASLDQDQNHSSVAARLLRNGAVAFVGNSRRGIAEQELFLSEFRNAVLLGQTLGQAHRSAQNKVLVAVLERGQSSGGAYFYQLYNQLVFGDPALQLGFAKPGAEQAARVEQRGRSVTVYAPQTWHRYEYTPNAEWNCKFDKLYSWRGAGVGVESTWHGAESRNAEVQFVNAEVHTRKNYNSIKLVGKTEGNLGLASACYVDLHHDGSRSLYWRVRLLDADMTTGEIIAQAPQLEFKLSK
ncbi:MAG: hypothetical protein ACI84O_000477 [Myxococcota bacterium]